MGRIRGGEWTLYLTLFQVMMGFGVVMPILPYFARELGATSLLLPALFGSDLTGDSVVRQLTRWFVAKHEEHAIAWSVYKVQASPPVGKTVVHLLSQLL